MRFVGRCVVVRGSRGDVRDLVSGLVVRCGYAAHETISHSDIQHRNSFSLKTTVDSFTFSTASGCIDAASCVRFSYPGFKSFISRPKKLPKFDRNLNTTLCRAGTTDSFNEPPGAACVLANTRLVYTPGRQCAFAKLYLFAFNFVFSTFWMILHSTVQLGESETRESSCRSMFSGRRGSRHLFVG